MDLTPLPVVASPTTPSILLVDDDPRNLFTLNAVLDGLDARLVSARSGSAALKALLDEDFALILLDVRMPDMDGFETASLIRQRLRSALTPIIFVTGNDATAAAMQQGYKVGAVDYIVKPFEPTVLRSKVAIFLDLHRKTEEIRRQAEMLRAIEEREHQRRLEALAAEERQRSEAEVRGFLERQAMVLEAVPLAVYTAAADPVARTLSITPNVRRLTGYTAEEFTGAEGFWFARVHPEDVDEVRALGAAVVRDGHAQGEYRWRCADGSYRWFLDQRVLIHVEGGNPEISGTWLDITERKANEEALRTAHAEVQARAREIILREEKLKVTLRSIADGVITTDTECRVRFMSHTAERLTGQLQADVEGRPLEDVFPAYEERTRARVDLAPALRGPTPQATALFRAPDGSERLLHFHAAPIRAVEGGALGMVLVFRDITDLRRRDEEVFKASKLESIGILAGGIAHDFNNLLTGIMASVSVAELRAARGMPPGDAFRHALAGCERARKLTQQLLTFSRGGAPVKALVNLATVVRDAAAFALQGSRSRAVVETAPGLLTVEADPGQIGQVVQNLVLNADQAMPNGGTVRVAVVNRIGFAGTATHPAGDYVVLSVADDGVGISPEHLPKIFDPFFTTRRGGTGIGLATVYSIVQHHGGRVEVASAPGQGTTFTVWLRGTREEPVVAPEAPVGVLGGGKGRILVMDDEAEVRVAAEAALELLGYEVTLTAEGAEAVHRFEAAIREGAPFEAVIMDLTVAGGMGGLEATRLIRQLDPGSRIFLSTGYSTDPVVACPEAHGFSGVIPKPWEVTHLDRALRRPPGGQGEPVRHPDDERRRMEGGGG